MKRFLGDYKECIFCHKRKKSIRDALVKPEDMSPKLRKMLDIKIKKKD